MQLIKGVPLILTSNPAEFVFKVPDALKTTGSYASAVIQIDVGNLPVDGDIWEIVFGDNTLAFTFSNTGADGVDPLILTEPVGTSAEDDLNLLMQELYRHPLISKYYTMAIVGDPASSYMFELRARNRGAAYSLSAGGGTTITFTALNNYVAGVNDEYYTSLDVLMRVYDRDGVDLITELQATGLIDPDSGQMKVTFYELPEVISTRLKNDIPIDTRSIFYSTGNGFFRVEVYRSCEGNLYPMQVQDFQDFQAQGLGVELMGLAAGLPMENFSPVENAQAHFNPGSGLDRFFTWQPRQKLVTYEQPEWLSLIITGGNYRKKFVIRYSDNTSTTHYVNFDVPEFSLVHIPSGALQNDLAAVVPAKTIVSYDFTLQDVSGPTDISETFTYILDERYQRNHRYFAFVNSVGGVDTIRCFGVKEFSKKFTRTVSEKVISSESRVSDGALEMVFNENEQLFTIRTGFQEEKATIHYYTDFLNSRLIKEIIMPVTEEQTVQPVKNVLMLSDKANMPADDDFTFGMEFSMKYAWNDTQFSNLTSTPEVYYDSLIELSIDVETASGLSGFQIVATDNDNIQVKINGVITDFQTSNTLNFDKAGHYHFIIRGFGLEDLSFEAAFCTCDITVLKIESRTLINFAIFSPRHLNTTYLTKRLSTLRMLQTLSLATTDTKKDELLFWCQRLWQEYGNLQVIDFSGISGTVSSRGQASRNYLIAAGLTVTAT